MHWQTSHLSEHLFLWITQLLKCLCLMFTCYVKQVWWFWVIVIWKINLHLTDQQHKLVWVWARKKQSERKGDHSGCQKIWDFPVMKKQFSSVRGCPHLLLDGSAISAVCLTCAAPAHFNGKHRKPAGFISLVPGHVNLLPSTCGKSSKVLGLLHYTKKVCADLKTWICFWGSFMCCLLTLRTV